MYYLIKLTKNNLKYGQEKETYKGGFHKELPSAEDNVKLFSEPMNMAPTDKYL